MFTAWLIGFVLCIVLARIARKLSTVTYDTNGWGNRVQGREKKNKLKFPLIVWIIYCICAFIPIVNLIVAIVILVCWLIAWLTDDDWTRSLVYDNPGKFVKFLKRIWTKLTKPY